MEQKGFTLIEMLVVVAILSIGWIGIVTSTEVVERIRFKNTVSEVTQQITHAQQLASLQNKRYSVMPCITATENSVHVEADAKVICQVDLPKTVKVKVNSGEISFNGDLSPSQAGTVFLTNTRLEERAELRVRPVTGEVGMYYFVD